MILGYTNEFEASLGYMFLSKQKKTATKSLMGVQNWISKFLDPITQHLDPRHPYFLFWLLVPKDSHSSLF